MRRGELIVSACVSAFLLALAALVMKASHDHEAYRNSWFQDCLADRKPYECQALWRMARL